MSHDPNRGSTAPAAVRDTPRSLRHSDADHQAVHRFVLDAARLMNDRHCEDVIVFDVRGLSDITDYILIASGTSDRQIVAVGAEVEELAQTGGLERLGREADAPAKWVVMDFVDVVVHLFDPATRAYYDLEMMWGDAPRVPWKRLK